MGVDQAHRARYRNNDMALLNVASNGTWRAEEVKWEGRRHVFGGLKMLVPTMICVMMKEMSGRGVGARYVSSAGRHH